MASSQAAAGVDALPLDTGRSASAMALPAGDTAWLRAAPGALVRRVLVTLDAPTAVCAGSRFEAVSADVISSVVHGLSPTGERLRLRSPVAIRTVHVAQAGARGYVEAAAGEVAAGEMGSWQFDESADARVIELVIGPSADGGQSLPVTCALASGDGTTRPAVRTTGRDNR